MYRLEKVKVKEWEEKAKERKDGEEEGRVGGDEVVGRAKEGEGGVMGEVDKMSWWKMYMEEEGKGGRK